jgi:hypothetical protein
MTAARLFICFLCIFSSVAPSVVAEPLRVSVRASGDAGLGEQFVGLLSHEIRKLDGVVVTDSQPQLILECVVVTPQARNGNKLGYAASIAVLSGDNRFQGQLLHVENTLESLAHKFALAVDGRVFEKARRAQSQ